MQEQPGEVGNGAGGAGQVCRRCLGPPKSPDHEASPRCQGRSQVKLGSCVTRSGSGSRVRGQAQGCLQCSLGKDQG